VFSRIGDRLQDLPKLRSKIFAYGDYLLDLSRFGAAPLMAYYATKEMHYGTNTGE
jgi:hypothetical protein